MNLKSKFRDYKIDTDNKYFKFNLWDKFEVFVYYEYCEEQSEYEVIKFDLNYDGKALETFEVDFDLEKTTQIDAFQHEVIREIFHFFGIRFDKDLTSAINDYLNTLKIENQISQIDISDRNDGICQDTIANSYQQRHFSSNDAVRDALKHFNKEDREGYFHDSIFDCRTKEYFDSVFNTFQEVGCLPLKDKSKVFIHESVLFEEAYFVLRNYAY